MTQDNLLNSDDLPVIDENKNYLDELVGEGKKFKDVEALAKGKAYSDVHAAVLERRLDALTADYIKQRESSVSGAKLQELRDQIEALQQQAISRETNPNSNTDSQPSLRPDDVKSIFSNEIAQYEQAKREQENRATVEAKLKERHGANYVTFLKEQSKELGLSDADVNQMAKHNPKVFFKTFGLDAPTKTEGFQAPPKSGVNTGFSPKTGEKRTMSYYEKLREKDPTSWLNNTKLRIQMDKDAIALGKEFFDT